MSFVGTRPEAVKYVEKYKPEYMATLLLPAGITSEAIITYIYKVLFEKMKIFSTGLCSCLSIMGIIVIAATGSRKALVMLILGGFLLFAIRFKSSSFLITVLKVLIIILITRGAAYFAKEGDCS